jgi:hypothetical protein
LCNYWCRSFEIGDTIADHDPEGLAIAIDGNDGMLFTINDSPFFGKRVFVTSSYS